MTPLSPAANLREQDSLGEAAVDSEGRPEGAERRRILIATYHFPPQSTVGGLRLAKFARLLPEHGWDTHVLTIDDRLRSGALDQSRLRGLERIPRTTTGELPRILEAAVGLLQRGKRAPQGSDGSSAPASASPAGPVRERLPRRLARYFMSLVWFLPDETKNWSLRAAPAAVSLIRRHRLDWVLTSGPPFSVHAIGLAARLLTKARWVADFRDPWMDLLHTRPRRTRSWLSDRIERLMEAAVIRRADLVMLTTEPMRQSVHARYPHLPAAKFISVPNSIDTDALAGDGRAEKFDVLTITYAGTLYFDRSPETLFRAVSDLVRTGIVAPDAIRIKLIGHCQEVDGLPTMTMVSRYGLDGVVEISEPIPYAEVVHIMRRSHLLLALAPERHRLLVGAKMYDYLGSGSALLVLADPGATADLVAQTGCGRCFGSDDVDGVKSYLASIIKDGSFRRLRTDPSAFAAFSARRLSGRLAEEMMKVDLERLDGVVRR